MADLQQINLKDTFEMWRNKINSAITRINASVLLASQKEFDDSSINTGATPKQVQDKISSVNTITFNSLTNKINTDIGTLNTKINNEVTQLDEKIDENFNSISNLNVKTRYATQSTDGIVQFSDLSELNAGVSSTTAVSAKDLRYIEENRGIPLGLLNSMPILFSGNFSSGVYPIGADGKTYVNWHICNGANGTPDLRNKFIKAGDGYNQGTAGGNNEHFHTVEGHALSIDEMPSHNHAFTINQHGNDAQIPSGSGGGYSMGYYPTTSTGGSQPHTHGLSSSNNEPEYYVLAYIMKIKS